MLRNSQNRRFDGGETLRHCFARNYTGRIRDELLKPKLVAIVPRGLIIASSRLH